ncbi:MAG: hypothetical protein GEU99_23980 [Luteitalea sp.]|nr:hypothetical protein [Luteitalea sp.]
MDRIATLGRAFFAVAIVAFGVQHVVHADFVTRVVPWWPDWIPGRRLWAGAVGAVLIGAGVAILMGKRTRVVAMLLGSIILLSFLFLAVPLAVTDSPLGGLWTWAGKALALSGGAFLVARSAITAAEPAAGGLVGLTPRFESLWSVGSWFFGAFLTLCGVQHFIHAGFVQSLVPSWIPGAAFWTYFAGVALIAGGIGVVIRKTAWLAGLLSGLMIFLWVVLLHIPRAAAAATQSTNETTAVFEALAMSGIAFLIAANVPPKS